ncbi:MAG: TonB-dependent receptor plug domain-containing protein, partial [Gammaproteobacteria bacterium]
MNLKQFLSDFSTAGLLCAVLSAGGVALLLPASAWAVEEDGEALGTIEEITVTSQKREQTSQDTALAVSAFDESAIDRENIDDVLDIQFSVPNFLYSKTNFTGANLSIRGVGNNAVAASSDSGAGIHFNGAYLVTSNLFESEFYDVARIEILRGPQGTLYGRNTTAGVVNVIPNKPSQEFQASGEMSFGNHRGIKYKSAVNLPLTNWFQVRTSLFRLTREGFVRNHATGNQIDDRDIVAGRLAFRLGGAADGPFELNIYYDHLLEEDSRLRQSKQVCHTDTENFYPYNLGCLPGQSLYSDDRNGSPTVYTTLAGFLGVALPAPAAGITFYPSPLVFQGAELAGLLPAGVSAQAAYNAATVDQDAFNPEDSRSVNQVIDPYYKVRNSLAAADMKWDWGALEINLVAGRQKRFFSSNNDYGSSGPNGQPVPFDATAVAVFNGSVSAGVLAALSGAGVTAATDLLAAIAGDTDTATGATAQAILAGAGQTALAAALAGNYLYSEDPVLTGHGQSTNGQRGLFGWDWSHGTSDGTTEEFRIQSDFDGWFNFLLGSFQLEYESQGYYDVHSNLLAAAAAGAPYSADGQYLGHFRNDTQSYLLNSEATFAEFYFGDENAKFTLGLRNTKEDKTTVSRQTLLNDPSLPFIASISNRSCGTSAWRTAGYGSGTGCGNNAVPGFTTLSNEWDEDTWKLGLDVRLGEGSLMYLTRASSYKSGGLNPPAFTGAFAQTFGPEYVESFEWG